MKKSNFVAMILGTIGGIFLALGMCMCLVTEWGAFTPGVVMGCVGLVVLIIMIMVYRKMENKSPISINKKTIGSIILGVAGAIILGVGMCLCMVWEQLIIGVLVGIVGIISLLMLIPLTKGVK